MSVTPITGDRVSYCTWLMGRGASMDCGLMWEEDYSSRSRDRDWRISNIKSSLYAEMKRANTDVYRELFDLLGRQTGGGWKHTFATTNWDTLIEREMTKLSVPLTWLNNSHVFHLNGSIKENRAGTPFLLKDDKRGLREPTTEGNQIYSHINVSSVMLIVGVSFECTTDRSLLIAIQNAKLLVRTAPWIVVNPCRKALDVVRRRLSCHLPRTSIHTVECGFGEWVRSGTPHLFDLLTRGSRFRNRASIK